jgi:bifunctional non-homologous end joining protein LigD
MTALARYKAKRSLKKTPEPKPRMRKRRGNTLAFVIHRHEASHLHFDLRLEVDGVLKSWAVPKGPPLKFGDKRLAIQVEDHPYDYKDFEGRIPEGNYGAGMVNIWDKGTYEVPSKTGIEALKAMRAGLKKGHIDFILNGAELHDEYMLIRMERSTGPKNAWLWLRRHSNESKESKEEKKAAKSSPAPKKVATQKMPPKKKAAVNDREANKRKVAKRNTSKRKATKKNSQTLDTRATAGVKARMPQTIHPMLATLIGEAFSKKGWLYEIKWDGYRAIAFVRGGRVRLMSRNQISFNKRYPGIAKDLADLPAKTAILDGEIVCMNEKGRPNFQQLQNWTEQHEGTLRYYVFDLLYLDGHDLRSEPLLVRKQLLKPLLAPLGNGSVQYSDHIKEKGIAFFKIAKKNHLEGIMAKNEDSTYQMLRSRDWLKIKTHLRQEVVIGGFTTPRGSRQGFGSLLVGLYKNGELKYTGHVGTGFSENTLATLHAKLSKLAQTKCPFDTVPKPNAPVTYVKPKLICEVSFTEWTKDGSMRHPVFEGLVSDKKPKEVVRE